MTACPPHAHRKTTLADCQLRLRVVTPAELTDVELREHLVQLEQIRSTADAAQALLMLEMTRRTAVEDAELSIATNGRNDDVAEFRGRRDCRDAPLYEDGGRLPLHDRVRGASPLEVGSSVA